LNISVSIILPVFNGAQYLEDCLESLWLQSFNDFECIVIDDGSTDDTSIILASQSDKRLRVLKQNVQGGICKALNLGIEFAHGKYLARMDADDICHPQRLQKQVEFLDKHQQVGFCGTWVRRFGEGQIPKVFSRPAGFQRIRAFSLFDNPFVHSTIMLRKDLFRKYNVRYRDDFAGAEDYELWTRLMENTVCENLSDVLLDYRVHSQSVTQNKTEIMDNLTCKILYNELCKLGLKPSVHEVLLHRLWSTGRFDNNIKSEQIERVESWLKRLLFANQTSQTYDQSAFLWAVRETWFALCYRFQALRYPILYRFFQSTISRYDIKHGAILMGALIKRHIM
jgi:glycosyltransferase involved in cell wall biosynthesis